MFFDTAHSDFQTEPRFVAVFFFVQIQLRPVGVMADCQPIGEKGTAAGEQGDG